MPARWLVIVIGLTAALLHFCFGVIFILKQPDIGWLIRTGELIVNSGSIPARDVFSWTAGDRHWIAYQWLFEVWQYLVFSRGGLWLVGLSACLAAGLLYFYALPRQWLAYGVPAERLAVMLPLALSLPWFPARPQLASFWLIFIFLSVLEAYRQGRAGRLVYVMPLLMVLWVNSHSFWFVGLICLFVYALTAQAARSGDAGRRRRLWLVCALTAAASLANPWGAYIYAYNSSFLTGTDYSINELMPPFMPDAAMLFLPFLLYAMVCSLALVLRRDRVPLPGLVLAGAGLLAGLVFRRYSPLSVLLSWPYLAFALRREGAPAAPAPVWRTVHLLGATAVSFAIWAATVPSESYALRTFTNNDREMLRFIKSQNDLGQRPFNDSTGSLLIFYGALPVFIDTRYDFYGRQMSDLALSIIQAAPGWKRKLDELAISHVIVKNDTALYGELKKCPDWLFAGEGRFISLWLRRNPENEARVAAWKEKPARLR